MAKLFANSGDPDQTPRSAASDLGLHCLPSTLLWVSRLQWVNFVGIGPEILSKSSAKHIQSTLVILNSLILNNRLSRSENLVPVITQRSTNRQQNIVCNKIFHNIFNISLTWESNYILILLKVVVRLIVFLSSANLICGSTDISKCFIESLGVRDNESRLYKYELKKIMVNHLED